MGNRFCVLCSDCQKKRSKIWLRTLVFLIFTIRVMMIIRFLRGILSEISFYFLWQSILSEMMEKGLFGILEILFISMWSSNLWIRIFFCSRLSSILIDEQAKVLSGVFLRDWSWKNLLVGLRLRLILIFLKGNIWGYVEDSKSPVMGIGLLESGRFLFRMEKSILSKGKRRFGRRSLS